MASASRWLAFVLAAALIAGGVAASLSSLYYSAAHNSRRAKDLPRVAAAAALAEQILPVNQQALALTGRMAALRRDPDAVLAAYQAVLRQAPADAFRWSELAQALAMSGDFSERLTQVIMRAQHLAPNSPAVNAALGGIAWRYEKQLASAQRAPLELSLQKTLNYKPERYKLFEVVARARQHHEFCEVYGVRMGARHWCGRIDGELAHCLKQKLRPAERRWCQRLEVLP